MDAIALLTASEAALAKRVERLRAQLDAVIVEHTEAQTALRVLAKLGVAPTVQGAEVRGSAKDEILDVLKDDEAASMTPGEIHAALLGKGVTTISPENVRTTLSRHKSFFMSDKGRYWRVPASGPDDDGFGERLGRMLDDAPLPSKGFSNFADDIGRYLEHESELTRGHPLKRESAALEAAETRHPRRANAEDAFSETPSHPTGSTS